MGSNYRTSYNVDIVMVIDCTGSMGPMIELVKNKALSFYSDFSDFMQRADKEFDQLRVRVIAFRDYLADGANAMAGTPFFTLPAQAEEFERVLRSIEPDGGGDEPEDGLEALAFAIRSNWENEAEKHRHVIVVWTDDGTHELGYGRESQYYPKDPGKMPSNFNELTRMWDEDMDYSAKRLLIFAPEKDYWTTVAEYWDNVLMFPSEAGKGLDKVTYDEILTTLVKSC